ncbi:tRNA (N6-threonylcarbamoyladenosine(37)-N6)-methyltransferase TrmO [bacterium]|nr:tRNA (N6-threonylcarbamoyladenosine(37)-N6)-methyltransferase TrmO [bacterium]
MEIKFKPIGVVHSPVKKKGTHRSGPHREHPPVKGELEIYKDYENGLKDVDGFSHLYVIFAFHKSSDSSLYAYPPSDRQKRGVFATRSPHRPNPVGLTIVKLIHRQKNILQVEGLDMIEGTPILDLKPYLNGDVKTDIQTGWLSNQK